MTSPFVMCDKLSLIYYYRMVQVSGAYLGPKYKTNFTCLTNAKCKCLEYKEGRDEGKNVSEKDRSTKSLSNHLIIGKTIANFQKNFNGLTKMKKLLYKLLAVFSQF